MNKKINPCIKGDKPFELTLNDCLACSGCLSIEENKITLSDLQHVPINMIMSHYSVLNLYNEMKKQRCEQKNNLHGITIKKWYVCLQRALMKTFNVKRFINTYDYQQMSNHLVYNEWLAGNKLILSECPGVVAYIERRKPELIRYLSEVPSLQQICAYLCEEEGVLTVSVMQCYDKRLEGDVRIDYVLSSRDVYEVVRSMGFDVGADEGVGEDVGADEQEKMIGDVYGGVDRNTGSSERANTNLDREEYKKNRKADEDCTIHAGDRFEEVHSSHAIESLPRNGIADHDIETKNDVRDVFTDEKEFVTSVTPYMIKKLNLEIERIEHISKSYRVLHFKHSNLMFAHITGLKSLLNFLNEKEMCYNFVDVFLCDNRCFGGPGQIENNVQDDYHEYFNMVSNDVTKEPEVAPVLQDKKRKFENRKVYKSNFQVEW